MSKAICCNRCGYCFNPQIEGDRTENGIAIMHFEQPRITEYGTKFAIKSTTKEHTYFMDFTG